MKNMIFGCICTEKCADIAPLVLRLVVGIVFAVHGYDKFQKGVPAITGFLTSLGFPAPGMFALILIVVELIGGIMMIAGVLTHFIAKLFVIVSIVALFSVHFSNGFMNANGGYEYILTLLAASFSLAVTGAGKYSIDGMRAKEPTATA